MTPFWVCRESNPRATLQEPGAVFIGPRLDSFAIILKGPDDNKTLMECRFAIGDYMDITITPPNSRMDRMDYGRRNFGGGDRYVFALFWVGIGLDLCIVSDPNLDWTLIQWGLGNKDPDLDPRRKL